MVRLSSPTALHQWTVKRRENPLLTMLNNATVINTVIVFRRCGYRVKKKKLMTLGRTHLKTNSRQLCGIVQLKRRSVFSEFHGKWSFFIAQKQLNGQCTSERECFRLFSRFAPHQLSTSLKKEMGIQWGNKVFGQVVPLKKMRGLYLAACIHLNCETPAAPDRSPCFSQHMSRAIWSLPVTNWM